MKTQTTSKKNTAKLTAALFALILLFPCCMDSGSGGSSDYDSGSNTENNGSQENPDEPDAPENPDEIYSADVESSVVVNLDGTCTVYVEVLISDDGKTTVEGVALESASVDPEAEYTLKPTGSKVNVIAFIAAKKNLAEKGVKNITCAYNSSTANFFLDFSENGFGETIYQKLGIPYGTATSESNAYFEWDDYGKAFNLPSNYRDYIKTDKYDRHIEIDGVDFLEKPFYYYVWPESYGGNIDCSIPKAFVFGEEVSKVDVSFGKEHNLIDAYKGGIILKNPAAKITSGNIAETNLTGALNTPTIDYDKKLRKFNENTLISYLYTESNLPNLSFDVNFFNISSEEDNFFDIGIDKLFENYYLNGASDKISGFYSVFDGKDYLNGGYMYDEAGNYNEGKIYKVDINVALLMCAHFKNIEITGDVTTEQKATLSVQNVRFSGNVSGLNFTATTGNGIIDFAKVGPKEIVAPSSKIIVNGVKNDTNTKIIAGRVVDFSGVEETLLKYLDASSSYVRTIYTKSGSFSGTQHVDTTFKTGSSASTNRAWEEAGRNGTLPSDSLSKLDVKAKADNPLLQKLLDENRPVYG